MATKLKPSELISIREMSFISPVSILVLADNVYVGPASRVVEKEKGTDQLAAPDIMDLLPSVSSKELAGSPGEPNPILVNMLVGVPS
jgi:hypothetical protein